MQFGPWIGSREQRPFRFGLLHAVFPKHLLTCFQNRLDVLGPEGLADRNEDNIAFPPPRCRCSVADPPSDLKQSCCSCRRWYCVIGTGQWVCFLMMTRDMTELAASFKYW
jgi:hypothetical protein